MWERAKDAFAQRSNDWTGFQRRSGAGGPHCWPWRACSRVPLWFPYHGKRSIIPVRRRVESTAHSLVRCAFSLKDSRPSLCSPPSLCRQEVRLRPCSPGSHSRRRSCGADRVFGLSVRVSPVTRDTRGAEGTEKPASFWRLSPGCTVWATTNSQVPSRLWK